MRELDRRFHYPYNTPGRCRKCAHPTYFTKQTGIMPPGETCPVCGWRKWDAYMEKPDFDVLPTR